MAVRNSHLVIRINRTERAALRRYARAQKRTIADLFRSSVLTPALEFDARQKELPLGKGEPPGGGG